MRRWLTLSQLGDHLAKRDPRVEKLNRKRRAEYAKRLVERVEKMEELKCLKYVGRRVLVSWRALESLLPADAATVDRLDTEMGKLNQQHRSLKGQVNGHGSALRDHGRRIRILEEKDAITAQYLADIAAVEGRISAAG